MWTGRMIRDHIAESQHGTSCLRQGSSKRNKEEAVRFTVFDTQ
jgi:hypothetical protein